MKTYKVLISDDGETEHWETIPARSIDALFLIIDAEGWDVSSLYEIE